jgi:hypothetical protein
MNVKDKAKQEHEANIELMQDLKKRLDNVENAKSTAEHPDPLKHKYISFIKSGFRIAAGFSLALGYFQAAGLLLVLAEILGIAEEVV